MKRILVAVIVLLIVLLSSGCTLDMLGYYDNASDGQAKSEKPKAFTSTYRIETVVEEDIVVEDEIIEDEQEAITLQKVIKKESPKSPPTKEKEQKKKVVDDKKKKTPEEIEKMKQEAKERVVNKLKEKDGEVLDENKGLSGWVEWRGNTDKSTLNLVLENAETGELYSESSDKNKNKKNAILRLYYNGQFIQEDPIVSLNLDGENKKIYTITKDCSWVKDDEGWVLDICKVDFKKNKFEPLLYNETQ